MRELLLAPRMNKALVYQQLEIVKADAELVEKVVGLADILHRDVATPLDARRILKLKGPENVNF
jgi:uncharacterized protein (DUF849 family)